LASQTSFTLTNGPAEDDALNGCVVCIHDVASAVQLGFGVISDYTGSTKTVTLTAGVSFTVAATDNISIYLPANVSWVGATAQTAGDIPALVTTVDTVVDGIQTDLDNATDGLGALKALIDAVDDFIDTEVAAILVDTGTTLDTKINTIDTVVDAIKVKTDSLTFTVAGDVDSNIQSINGLTAGVAGLQTSASTIVTGAAEAGTLSTTQMTTDLSEATDDHYNGRVVIWTSGVLANQASDITDYLGSTGMLTYTAVTEAPSAADTFVIV